MSANDSQIKSLYNSGIEKKVISPKTNLNLFRSAWKEYPIEVISLEKKLNKIKSSFFNNSIKDNDFFKLLALTFLFFFVFRYLIYATIWSIKKLKE